MGWFYQGKPVSSGRTMPPSDHAGWFTREVQPHESALRSWLRAMFPTLAENRDDLVQESYLRLIRARETGEVRQPKAFLFTTARNLALDLFRRRKVVTFEPVADMASLSVMEDRPGVADAVSRQQELELLAEAVRDLPDRCRQVMTLRLLYGLSHKEIAAELAISEFTVKAQLAKGMRRCAGHFERRGVPTRLNPSAE